MKLMRLLSVGIASLALLLVGSISAYAQYGGGIATYQAWTSLGRVSSNPTIATTTTLIQLPPAISGTSGTRGLIARICNTNASGAGDFYLKFGLDNTVTVTVANGSWLAAGKCGNFNLQLTPSSSYPYVAMICSGTCTASTAYIETGVGNMAVGQ
jgi:hypothetical protein